MQDFYFHFLEFLLLYNWHRKCTFYLFPAEFFFQISKFQTTFLNYFLTNQTISKVTDQLLILK